MPPRLFTLEEASALLPTISELMRRLQAGKQELDDLSSELERLMERSSGNGHALGQELVRARDGVAAAASEVESLLNQIGALGCEVKGIEQGLVDFPSLSEGRVVYLCWRVGEEAIDWWHEVDAGFTGRQRL